MTDRMMRPLPSGLVAAARQLAEDGILNDPSDDDILLAAADLCDYKGDLLMLEPSHRKQVIRAWERSA